MKRQGDTNGSTSGGALAATIVSAVAAAAIAWAIVGYVVVHAVGIGSGGRSAAAGPWLKAAFASPLSIICGIVAAGSAAALAVLCGAMWAAGAAGRGEKKKAEETRAPGAMPLPVFGEGHVNAEHALPPGGVRAWHPAAHGQDAHATSEQGAATLEFALVLPIALMIVLIMIQSSLLLGGNLCVHYAAFCAARSAIVVVPSNMAEEPPNVVGDPAGSGKLRRINMAAQWAVLPISCTNQSGPSVSPSPLNDGLAAMFAGSASTPPWVSQNLGQRLAYAQQHTTVTLDPPAGRVPVGGPYNPIAPGVWGNPGSTTPPGVEMTSPYYNPGAGQNTGAYAPAEDLHVHIQHDFYLSIPYAGRIFSAFAGGKRLDFGQGQYAMTIQADCTLTNEGEQDFVEVELFPKDRVR